MNLTRIERVYLTERDCYKIGVTYEHGYKSDEVHMVSISDFVNLEVLSVITKYFSLLNRDRKGYKSPELKKNDKKGYYIQTPYT